MKRIISFLFLIFVVSLLSFAVLAVEEPPSLDNHQFYGAVYWDKTAKDPQYVVAKVGGQTFSSLIKKVVSCGDNTCTGSYGSDPDNILRVQAEDGQTIQFFLDAVAVGKADYQSWEVSELNFNGASFPIEKKGCVEDWKCGSWSDCSAGTQTRSCNDLNKCDSDLLKKKEEQKCGTAATKPASTTDLTCSYDWTCTSWSSCTDSKQIRTCTRIDDCDAAFAAGKVAAVIHIDQPVGSQSCISGLTGSLPLKQLPSLSAPSVKPTTKPVVEKVSEETAGISVWLYVGIAIIVVAIVGLVWMLRRKSPPSGY